MNLLVDTHTHTVASLHAYSTLKENAQAAFAKGLQGFVLSDHGPAIEGCAPTYMLSSVTRFLPDYIEGVRVIKGAECNILDYEGTIDIPEKNLQYTEFSIASLHEVTCKSGSMVQNTDALMGALHNPFVDVIGHSGNANYPIDKERYVKEVAKLSKLLEINNHSFGFRKGSWENCTELLLLCKKHSVRIVVGSDAHFCEHIGEFDNAKKVLEDCAFPQELVLSANLERFLGYVRERRVQHPVHESVVKPPRV